MSLAELEQEVQSLSQGELSAFIRWIDNYSSRQWDEQFEKDVESGRLKKLGKKADLAFESGMCTEL